jgi:hypothetical protein
MLARRVIDPLALIGRFVQVSMAWVFRSLAENRGRTGAPAMKVLPLARWIVAAAVVSLLGGPRRSA